MSKRNMAKKEGAGNVIHIEPVTDSVAWIAPKAGFVLLTQSEYNNYPKRERAIRAESIDELREDDDGGTWVLRTNGRLMKVDENRLEILEAIEMVYNSRGTSNEEE